jgi:Flp pilus assembly secretin CpaC
MGWLLAALLTLSVSAPAHAAEPIVVQLDRTTLIKLPPRTTTVVIGDPLIADLSIQPGGVAVITGKGYGETNVIALDRDGAVLAEETVEVNGPGDPIVVVDRGDARNL